MNTSSALAGLAAGLSVRQGSGRPGADGATIRVRGLGTLNDNTPLFLVDGIIVSNIDVVNPNDIESISILKDAASAAIYGAQGANGVVLITTKKGSKDKFSITYSGMASWTSPINKLNMVTDYAEHMKLINEGATNVGQAAIFTDATIQEWVDAKNNPKGTNVNGVPNWLAYPNTDWFDVIFQNNLSQNHNISATGGSEKSSFLISFGYQDNQGVMAKTGSKRYQMRVNVESKPFKFLTVGMQNFATVINSELGNTESAFNFLSQTTPGVYPKYKGKYGYPSAAGESGTANNIMRFLEGTDGRDLRTRLSSSVYANLALFKGLSFDSRFNYSPNFDEYNSYPVRSERWDFATNTLREAATALSAADSYYSFAKSYSYTLEEILRYNTTINDVHEIGAIAGYNEYYSNNYNFNATKKGLLDYSVTTLTPTSEILNRASGSESDRAIRSYFGRVNYGFKSRYLLEANIRRDGVSQFAPARRWGTYKSFSAGWRISEEPFFANVNPGWVNELKLRGSWGDLGNNRVPDYVYQATYGAVGYSFNGIAVNGVRPSIIANPGLRWETTRVTNLGLDVNLFNKSNLDLSVEVYRKSTYDVLINPSIYLTAGVVSPPWINQPEVENKGIEVTTTWKNKVGEVEFAVGGNFTYNHNKVTKYRGPLVEGFNEVNGTPVYSSNIGNVSDAGKYLNADGTQVAVPGTILIEGHMLNEFYLPTVYHGDGSYFNGDGSVNVNGGPTSGMIRTPEDLAWVQAMMTAGYKFQGSASVAKNQLYYGDLIYADNNEDGVYGSSFDNVFTGKSSTPKFLFGLNISATWKNFDFAMIWSGAAGMHYLYNTIYNRSTVRNGTLVNSKAADNRYYYNDADPADPANNIDGSMPRLKLTGGAGDAINDRASDFWLFNASYIKLRNLQIGYTLPESLSTKAHISRARIFASGENLLTITKYPGLDPEIDNGLVNYPTMKQYAVGVNVTF
jgi:TonB-linked SusC/RagA family outer membrane protein